MGGWDAVRSSAETSGRAPELTAGTIGLMFGAGSKGARRLASGWPLAPGRRAPVLRPGYPSVPDFLPGETMTRAPR